MTPSRYIRGKKDNVVRAANKLECLDRVLPCRARRGALRKKAMTLYGPQPMIHLRRRYLKTNIQVHIAK